MTATLEAAEIPVGDGSMLVHVARPDAARANGAGIIVFQEAFGVNDQIKRVACRFADLGLLAVTPELYHRAGHGTVISYDDVESAVKIMNANITREGLIADIRATADWIRDMGGVSTERLASIGFCMGGRVSFIANAHLPLAAAVGFYGTLAPGSLDLVSSQHGPLLLFWAGLDANIRPESTRAAADALAAAGKEYVEVVFARADHGFFCEDRAAVYDAAAASESWALTQAFLRTHGVLGAA